MTIEEQYKAKLGGNLPWRVLVKHQGWRVVGGPFWNPMAFLRREYCAW